MKKNYFLNSAKLILAVLVIFSVVRLLSCTPAAKNKKEIGSFELIDPSFSALVRKDASVSIIAEGFDWCEGPLWIEKYNMLLFSDVPQNIIYKWTPEKGKEPYLKPSGYTDTSRHRGGETGSNGLTLNTRGQLVLCQQGDRQIAVMDAPLNQPAPKFTSLANNYSGKKFDSPNDVVFRSNGDLFFTDPPYGLEKNVDDPLKEAPYQGVYRVKPDGQITMMTDSIARPNGLAFLPGEKTIIIASSDPKKAVWYAYDFDQNDAFTNKRIFYDATRESKKETGLPDGLKIDHNGNVYASGPGGIWVFNKEAKLLGKIRINGVASNCAFADDEKTLYVTADMYLLKVKLR